ncbi:hypothetical protein SZ55_1638 [Pseudomonas sp. FeS53a]|nr:hypothetical protein SZ55_1638 [Pseudomonas sp. FeS53a]
MTPHALGLEERRPLFRPMGLGTQQGCQGQHQAARLPPESSRLQGQTSTVLFLWVAPNRAAQLSQPIQDVCHFQ